MNNLFSAEIYKERVNWKLRRQGKRTHSHRPRATEVSVAVLLDGVFVFPFISTAQMNIY